MIARVALAFGIVWLCMPQHPDLGLPAASAFAAADGQRSAFFQRLVEIKHELQGLNGSSGFSVVGVLEAVDGTGSLGSHPSVHRLVEIVRGGENP